MTKAQLKAKILELTIQRDALLRALAKLCEVSK